MPKIVDKQSKRSAIAKSSIDLFIEKGFLNLTVSEVAKNAGVGKGTVYGYFKSKEDIVFEIMRDTQNEYDRDIALKIKNAKTPKEKVLNLFELCLLQDSKTIKRRKIYREFLTVCMSRKSDEIACYQIDSKDKYLKILNEIIEDGIKNRILKPNAIDFVNGLFLMAEGYLVLSNDENKNYSEDILISYIDSLFKLLEE